MSGEDYLDLFKTASSQWLCDPYSVEIRFISRKAADFNRLLACTVSFWPIGTSLSQSLRIDTNNNIIAGREVITDCSLAELETFIVNLEQGRLVLKDSSYILEAKQGLSYYSEMISNDRWYCDAHLIINGESQPPFSSTEIAKINSELRLAELPFDGIQDLLSYLNLTDAVSTYKQAHIEVRISPPVDIRVDESNLSQEQLSVTLHAHKNLDIKSISLAIQEFPESLSSRKQVSSYIEWVLAEGRQVGKLNIKAPNAFAVKAILMAGKNTVRRQFFEDILKVPNRRLFAISAFDSDLKKLKKDLTDTTNSDHFEKAVNSLAYILGFSGCVMNESSAPDIILSTKNDNLVLIECTLKVSDFNNKLGKLVDRRNALDELLQKARDTRKVHSYLICGQPKAAILYDPKPLLNYNIVLLTKESILQLLENLAIPQDPDELLLADERLLQLSKAQSDQIH